eukprot:236288_1
MIIMVGFAVDPPPGQLTPSHIIIKMILVKYQMLYEKQYCSVVTKNIIPHPAINLIELNNGRKTNINIMSLYDAAVGLYLHPIKNKGASSTLGAQIVEIP